MTTLTDTTITDMITRGDTIEEIMSEYHISELEALDILTRVIYWYNCSSVNEREFKRRCDEIDAQYPLRK